jgi:hypothetical protein
MVHLVICLLMIYLTTPSVAQTLQDRAIELIMNRKVIYLFIYLIIRSLFNDEFLINWK